METPEKSEKVRNMMFLSRIIDVFLLSYSSIPLNSSQFLSLGYRRVLGQEGLETPEKSEKVRKWPQKGLWPGGFGDP